MLGAAKLSREQASKASGLSFMRNIAAQAVRRELRNHVQQWCTAWARAGYAKYCQCEEQLFGVLATVEAMHWREAQMGEIMEAIEEVGLGSSVVSFRA